MTTINLSASTYRKWTRFYQHTADKIKFPTLKNFTEQKLLEIVNADDKKK